MKKFVAVDTGKFATKVAVYDEKANITRKFAIRTAHCDGDFRDDAIEDNTVIIQIGDGPVYKVGNGARGIGAELTTEKKLEVHRICAITALASCANKSGEDEFYVATLLPAKDWRGSKREISRLLPEGKVTVNFKSSSASSVDEKTFTIKQKFVFTESEGALFMEETIGSVTPNSLIGLLDIGNFNLNATVWQGKDFVQDMSSTADLGGSLLIQEIAQEISTNVTSCNDRVASTILKTGKLPDGVNVSKEQEEAIFRIVSKAKKLWAEKVKRVCHGRNWSLELMSIIAIGGTAKDIESELKATFGENLTVIGSTENVNALGALRMMCARLLDKIVPVTNKDNSKQ